MSSMTVLSGAVSAVRVNSSTTVNTTVNNTTNEYNTTSSASTQVVTNEKMNFRIDNRAAFMDVRINLTDGDKVTAACVQKGEFEVIAIKNHTTKMIYYIPKPAIYPEIIYIILGVFTTGFYGIGFVLIGGGIWFLINKQKKIKLIREGVSLVEKAPTP
jgi:hypothetical protein